MITHILASGSPLPGFLNSLAGPLNHYGLLAVLFFVLIEDFGIPVPGETILIAASIYAGSGRLNVVAVGVIGFVAAVTGDNIGFAIGHFGGRALVLRWGRYVRLTEKRLDKAEAFFERHGGWIITVARFIEVLRQVNGLVAGISGMRWRRFLVFNALGAALWVGTWVSLGYFAGNHIGTIYHYIALVGYDDSGDKVLVADPAATGCGDGACGSPSSAFYNTPKSYWINTSDLGVWITPKGYTWHP